MLKIINRLLILLVFIGVYSCKSQEESYAINTYSTLNNFIENLENSVFSGSILVAHKGDIIINKGFGKSNIEDNLDNTSSTIFDIGSITKQFTGAGILKLEMQGKLSVNDKISRYFPEVPEDKKDITIHHLLTHSSGLIPAIGDDYEEISEQDFVSKAFKQPLLFKSGSNYEYSNVGYSLLALIIEKTSGVFYEEYLRNNLFSPANMNHTGYVLPKWDDKEIAIGYNRNKVWGKPNDKKWNTNAPYLNLKGNGGILSTTEDLYKWHKVLDGTTILSDEAKAKYYGKHIKEGEDASSYYGYGWAIFPTSRNTDLIAHNGGNGIFFADFWRYLNEDIVIILMTNKADRQSERICSQIASCIIYPEKELSNKNKSNDYTFDDSIIETLSNHVFLTIKDGNQENLKSFLNEYCTTNFKNMAPLETHYKFLGKMKERLNNGKITNINIDQDEVILEITTNSEVFDMILNVIQTSNNKLKIDGIMLD
ncbi:serine hydrolase [Olleya sp. AH-315-F22]|nr:serine hydrolase [Olleya sp. AH-315-F22]